MRVEVVFEIRVGGRLADFDSLHIAAEHLAGVESGEAARAASQHYVGARRAHLEVESDRRPISVAVDLIGDHPVFDDREIAAGVVRRDAFGAHAGGEMVPSGTEMELLNPSRVVALEVRDLQLARPVARVMPGIGGELGTVLPPVALPVIGRLAAAFGQIAVDDHIRIAGDRIAAAAALLPAAVGPGAPRAGGEQQPAREDRRGPRSPADSAASGRWNRPRLISQVHGVYALLVFPVTATCLLRYHLMAKRPAPASRSKSPMIPTGPRLDFSSSSRSSR